MVHAAASPISSDDPFADVIVHAAGIIVAADSSQFAGVARDWCNAGDRPVDPSAAADAACQNCKPALAEACEARRLALAMAEHHHDNARRQASFGWEQAVIDWKLAATTYAIVTAGDRSNMAAKDADGGDRIGETAAAAAHREATRRATAIAAAQERMVATAAAATTLAGAAGTLQLAATTYASALAAADLAFAAALNEAGTAFWSAAVAVEQS